MSHNFTESSGCLCSLLGTNSPTFTSSRKQARNTSRTLLTLIIVQLLAFLTSVLQLPLEIQLPLRDRLFYGFHGHQYRGRDLFALISNQEYLFWLNTGETTDSFLQMA